MLHNRNLARYYTAEAVYIGTRGQTYLSEIDVKYTLARSSKRLTPDMFAGLANVLGIPVAGLADLTGFDLPPPSRNRRPWRSRPNCSGMPAA